MPNIKSAAKRVEIARIRTARNSAIKSKIKTAVKKFQEALVNNPEGAKDAFVQAVRTIDKAAAKGVIHKNTAARKKSKLQKSLNHVIG